MIKIWITGANGQIGTAINEVLDPLEAEVFNTDKERTGHYGYGRGSEFWGDEPSGRYY